MKKVTTKKARVKRPVPVIEITSAGLMVFRDHELEMELLGLRRAEWLRLTGQDPEDK